MYYLLCVIYIFEYQKNNSYLKILNTLLLKKLPV